MTKYTITFTITTAADPSAILDAANDSAGDIILNLEAVNEDSHISDDDTVVTEVA